MKVKTILDEDLSTAPVSARETFVWPEIILPRGLAQLQLEVDGVDSLDMTVQVALFCGYKATESTLHGGLVQLEAKANSLFCFFQFVQYFKNIRAVLVPIL